MASAGLGMLLGAQQGIIPGIVAFGITIILAAPAFLLLRFFRLPEEGSPIDIPMSLGAGLVCFAYLSDLVFMSQLLNHMFWVNGWLAFSFVCFPFTIKAAWKSLRCCGNNSELSLPSSKVELFLWGTGWFIVFHLFLGFYIGNIVPPTDGDALNSYQQIVKMIASGMKFDDVMLYIVDRIISLNRMAYHVYALGFQFAGVGGMHLFNFVFICISAYLLHTYAASHLKLIHPLNPFGILILFSIFELTITGIAFKVDYFVAMLVVMTAIAVFSKRWANVWVALSIGLLITGRVSAIPTAFVMWLVFSVGLLMPAIKSGEGKLSAIKQAVVYGLVSTIVAIPVYGMQFILFGNPVFPFYNEIFGNYVNWRMATFDRLVFYPVDGVLAPFKIYWKLVTAKLLSLPSEHHFGQGLNPLYLVIPFMVNRRRELLQCWLFFMLGFVVWSITGHFHRQFLGVAFVGSLLILFFIFQRVKNAIVQRAFMVLVLGFAAFAMLHPYYNVHRLGYFLGLSNADMFYDVEIHKTYRGGRGTPKAVVAQDILKHVGQDRLLSLEIDVTYPDAGNRIRIAEVYRGTGGDCFLLKDELLASAESEGQFVADQFRKILKRLDVDRSQSLSSSVEKRAFMNEHEASTMYFIKYLTSCPGAVKSFMRLMGIPMLLAGPSWISILDDDPGLAKVYEFSGGALYRLTE